MHCVVYRSSRKEDTYLYLRDDFPFSELPAILQQSFGEPVRVMSLELSEGRELARADVNKVMAELQTQGFYLQLPPPKPELAEKI